MHATISKGNMGYDRYTVSDDCSCRTYFCCFPLALANAFSWPFVQILSNFFEEQLTQNHPLCLSGLSRALFPTTFLEIAVFEINRTGTVRETADIWRRDHWFPREMTSEANELRNSILMTRHYPDLGSALPFD